MARLLNLNTIYRRHSRGQLWYVVILDLCDVELTSVQEATIRSKHGIILSCEIGDSRDARHAPVYEWIRKALKDQRYGFLPPLNIRLVSEDPVIQSGVREVWAWLCEKMDQEGYHEGR